MSQVTNSDRMTERPLTDFHTYYRKKIRPYLLDLEYKRERFVNSSKVNERNYLIASVVAGLLLGAANGYFELLGAWSWAFSVPLAALPVLVMKFWLGPVIRRKKENDAQHEDFYNRYKSKVVESIVRFFDPSLRLDHTEQISKEVLRKSQLVQNLADIELDGDDFVSGSINKIPISFSELQVTNIHHKEGNCIFHGIFFSAVLKQKCDSAIFIVPKPTLSTVKLSEASVGTLSLDQPLLPHQRAHNIRAMQESMRRLNAWSIAHSDLPLQEVPIDHVSGNTNYAVFSTQPETARQILAKGFWSHLFPEPKAEAEEETAENMLESIAREDDFHQSVSKGYYISLIGDELYIMQPQGGDLFEPNMEESFLEEESLTNYHDHLRQAFNLIDYLNNEVKLRVEE